MGFVNSQFFYFWIAFLRRYKAAPILPPLSPGQKGTNTFLNILLSESFPLASEFKAQPPDRTRFSFLPLY